MATARKLPSGSWRCQISSGGVVKSFTRSTKKAAELAAVEWANGRKIICSENKTVEQAVREYIISKENILSPSSVRGYYIILNNALDVIAEVPLCKVTEKKLQTWISYNAKHYEPKTIKSQFSLVCAALRQEKISLDYKSILLPRIQKKEKLIPTMEEIGTILKIVEGTSVELPVTIAVCLGLRQSEIAGLKWTDYDGEYLYIHAAKVPDKDNKYVFKESTKSEASTRAIDVDELTKIRLDRAEHKGEFISTMLPSSVLRKFNQLCDQNGLPRFTMHAQRHGNASMMLAEGIPDKYAMKRLGQSSPNMIKDVYQHLYDNKEKEVAEKIGKKFAEIYKHENSHDNEKNT